jgi:hypothetical protein
MRLRNILGNTVLRKALILGVVSVAMCGEAQAALVALWTFETSAPVTAGPFNPETGAGQALGKHTSGSTVYSSPAGNGSSKSFSSNNWAIGDYYQFKISTLGLGGINLAWDQTGSATGPRDFVVKYSTDGVNFTNFGSQYAVQINGSPNSPWSSLGSPNPVFSFSNNLSAITALNNQANVYLRLVMNSSTANNGSPVAAGGTNRVDNVAITATPVPEPATLAMGLAGAIGLVGYAVRRNKLAGRK